MKVLVGVDLSEATEKIVDTAEKLAKALSAKIWLLYAVKPEPADFYAGGHAPDSPQAFRDSLAKRFHEEHRHIQALAERLRQAGLDTTALLVEGSAIEAILEESLNHDIDMIIVGSHGRGAMSQLLLGSVSEGVLHRSETPILVVPTHNRS